MRVLKVGNIKSQRDGWEGQGPSRVTRLGASVKSLGEVGLPWWDLEQGLEVPQVLVQQRKDRQLLFFKL